MGRSWRSGILLRHWSANVPVTYTWRPLPRHMRLTGVSGGCSSGAASLGATASLDVAWAGASFPPMGAVGVAAVALAGT